MPFPLSFAPALPYHGVLPVHFSPTFFEPGKEGYWSYVVVWVKAGAPRNALPQPQLLEQDLRTYYTGLCGTNGHPTTHTRSPGFVSHEAHLASVPLAPEDRAAGGERFFQGDLEAVDCIVTGDELALHVEAVAGACDDRTSFTAYTISPRPPSDPVWAKLRAERRAFDCRHPATEADVAAILTPPSDPAAAIPDTPAGRALTWVLGAIVRTPTEAEVTAHFAPSFLVEAPARQLVEAYAQRGAAFSPPIVERVLNATPERLEAVLRSGNREAPILGREYKLSLAVDPADPTRILSVGGSTPTEPDTEGSPPR